MKPKNYLNNSIHKPSIGDDDKHIQEYKNWCQKHEQCRVSPQSTHILPPDDYPNSFWQLSNMIIYLSQKHVKNIKMHMTENDYHYSPLNPDMYIKYRIEVVIKFYQKRIPLCIRTRDICQIVQIGVPILAGENTTY